MVELGPQLLMAEPGMFSFLSHILTKLNTDHNPNVKDRFGHPSDARRRGVQQLGFGTYYSHDQRQWYRLDRYSGSTESSEQEHHARQPSYDH